ncbi:MAG: fucose isomerase, partial [Bacillota bacterium]
KEKTYGAVYGNIKPGNLSFARVSTNDINGKIKAYVAEGKVIDEELAVNGSRGVVEVPELQELLQYICRQGFEHHVAISLAPVGDILEEAFSNYLGWDVYNHL